MLNQEITTDFTIKISNICKCKAIYNKMSIRYDKKTKCPY